jgi:8-oxo-dGTP pyrophosphatase MutT (NUDIX family)
MIQYGYRIYDGLDGRLHFDQIVAGRIYPLRPEPEDEERQRGYYDHQLKYLGEDPEDRESTPDDEESGARADADQPSAESAAKMPPGPARAAGILLLHRSPEGDKVLFVRHAQRGTWEIPGGHLEEHETADVAAEREVLEEIELGPEDYGDISLLLHNTLGGTDFSTFIAHIASELEPNLADGELDDWQWASPESPPEPLHPGLRVVLERLHMHELDLARAIASGEFSSPQQYENVWLFAVRVTGTGASYREELKEHVWRPPELYLNADFLARCAGLPVIIQHPETDELTTEEYADRVIGALSFAYIEGDEVWAIARIYDQDAAKLMRERQLSTSPAVVFRDPSVNETRKLGNGKTLFIEGEPSLLDHLAICEAGVWDKGGAPSGVAM